MSDLFERHVAAPLREALARSPAVLLQGARQTGKSTLARWLLEHGHQRHYVTLDDATTLAAAREDPEGFLAAFEGPVVIDEVQRARDLFLALKASVDRDRTPGRFLLTGSAHVLTMPRLADALVGRMELVTLWPLSQGEIDRTRDTLVDAVFSEVLRVAPARPRRPLDLEARLVRGGYPEVVMAADPSRPAAWIASYVTTILEREVRDLAQIEGLMALPRLLALLASRPMAVLNHADVARSSGLPQSTVKRYLALLEATFLVQTLPAWYANLGKRLAKSPKALLVDSGLAAHLIGADAGRLRQDRSLLGGLLEAFVVMELKKQLGWSRTRAALYHYRTHDGDEVDVVLERPDGRLVGVEVKAASSVGSEAFRGLRAFAQATGGRFHRGIVLYTGTEVAPFGPRLQAVPLSALWDTEPPARRKGTSRGSASAPEK